MNIWKQHGVWFFSRHPFLLIKGALLTLTVLFLVFFLHSSFAATPNLVASYSFNEGTGATVGDGSENGNNGSINGAMWAAAGKYGGALSFNGTSSLVAVPDSASLDLTNGITVEAWVRPTSSSGWRTVVMKERLGGLAYTLYSHNSGNRPGAYVSIGSSDQFINGSAAVPLNAWTHLAMTYDGTNIRIYINAVLRGTRSAPGAAAVSASALTIGGNSVWGEYFSGLIDEVRLYNRALTVAEIQADMNTPLGGPAISITAPTSGATVSGTIQVDATASGSAPIAGVQFRVDGNDLGSEDTSAPYSVSWLTTTASDGTHSLTAIARDTDGKTSTSGSVNVIVSNAPPAPPTISMTSPVNGATVSGTINVSASATNVIGVQFLLDGINLGTEDTTAPHSVSWDTSTALAGPHSLSARARNAVGNTTSSPVSVSVDNNFPGGQWSSVINLPIVPVHSVLLHTGKVLIFDRPSAGPTARVWDPVANTFTAVPNNTTDLFCAGHSALADGRILVVGGHGMDGDAGTSDVNIFDPVSMSWTLVARMAYKRWYPTATTLPDGRVLATTGAARTVTDYVTIPEVYDPGNNTWTRLTGANANLAQYGHMFLLPNGKIGYSGNWEFPGDARMLDVATQSWTILDNTLTDGYSVMYEPGKILKCGSASDSGLPGLSTNACNLLDFNSATPAWQSTTPMAHARTHHNMTLLPDGNVLITGGSTRKEGYDTSFAVRVPEMWSPVTKVFTPMAGQARPRLYHSEALLLPDGRVLSMGGGRDGSGVDQLNAEIFSPPYLFKRSRPSITSAPDVVTYASNFTITTPDAAAVSSVVLMRLGAPTHGFDSDQRIVKLTFSQSAGSLTSQAPANANLAPPGYYMLFLVNVNGVPSIAKFLRIPTVTSGTPPTAPVSLTASGGVGTVSLAWQAASSSVGISNYNVHRSTTPGFTPTAANRIAQPVPTNYLNTGLSAGRYYFIVTAEDTNHLFSGPSNEAFADIVADAQPPQVLLTSPTNPNVTGTIVVSANATDDVGVAGVQFLLDGVNLLNEVTAPPYAISWNSASATNGSHTLAARARDTGGNLTSSGPFSIVVSNSQLTGLVAAYSFSEGTGSSTADRSGNGNTGTLFNATWTPAGKFGGALSFNGTNARVTVADSPSLDLTTGMTLMAWVQPSAITNWRTVVLKEAPSNLAYSLYSNDDTNRPSGWFRAGSADRFVTGNAQLPSGGWSHVAVTYNGSALRVYVNGAQAGSKNVTGNINVSSLPLQIGGNTIWGEYFAGLIDEVRVYNRALSVTEIQSDINTPLAP